jgi:hypothetical protein
MLRQPLSLNPTEARVLTQCSLHYHFARQTAPPLDPIKMVFDQLVRQAIQHLHTTGGPARLSLEQCLASLTHPPQIDNSPPDSPPVPKTIFTPSPPLIDQVRPIIEKYYHRLKQDWAKLIAANETLELSLAVTKISVILNGTVDRLDRTRDDGILAILFRTEAGPLPKAEALRADLAMTIYHALVAANYPAKRPVRLQEWWLQLDRGVTIELSEDEYRQNLARLREPVQALAQGEVRAKPGLHCESCYFKRHGCPVYANQNSPDDLATIPPAGKISPRQWIFKI